MEHEKYLLLKVNSGKKWTIPYHLRHSLQKKEMGAMF